MTAEQRKRVESLFKRALAIPADQWPEFLARNCADDDQVCQEVSSLLPHFRPEDELLDQPAISIQEGTPDIYRPRFHEGDHIGEYEVLGLLGAGAMGEVHLARDPRLGRKVAIKILPLSFAHDPDLTTRLQREAQAASALNHPNILTIHEFGRQGDLHYIVSEFIEGRSLRQAIAELTAGQALDYARQIGLALAAAHNAGIVHRDIKPENIMVRTDGFVKVVDFGLAKAGAQPEGGGSLYARLRGSGSGTAPGLLMGTLSYMSPEQLRGQPLDQRTDIWSWGVVLYEMLTGRRPFEAANPGDVLAAILDRELKLPVLGKRLERVLRRALAKPVEQRYGKLEEALDELAHADVRDVQKGRRTRLRLRGGRRRPAARTWLLAAAGVLTAAVCTVAAFELRNQPRPVRLTQPTRLTSSGKVTRAAISPDGSYIAYVVGVEGGREALRLSEIGTGADTERFPPVSGQYYGVTFSQGFLWFVIYENQLRGTLYRAPMLAGDPKVIVDDVDSAVSFCPGSSRLVFTRQSGAGSFLMMKDVKSLNLSTVATLQTPDHFWSAPLCSADGRMFVSESYSDVSGRINLIAIQAKDGKKQVIWAGDFSWMYKPVWLGEKSILVAGIRPSMSRAHLAQIFLPKGQSFEISGDVSDYLDVDSTADAGKVAVVQKERLSGIWLVSLSSGLEPHEVTASGARFYGAAWTKAGKVVSYADSGGHPVLWAVNPSTGQQEALIEDEWMKQDPEASLDGRYLIYTSNRDGTFHLWRSRQDGQAPARLTAEPYGEESGAITPDGQWVIYTSLRNGFRSLWKIPIEGGQSVEVSANPIQKPSVSPDGRYIACEYQDGARGWVAAVLDAKTGRKAWIFPEVKLDRESHLGWSHDSRNLLYVVTENGVSNIWSRPIHGGSIPVQITPFKQDRIFSFSLSPDGRTLACIRGKATSDVVLFRVTEN